MELFNTNNIEIVKCCQQEFRFSLPSITLAHRTENFLGKIRHCENFLLSKDSCVCKILYFVTLPAIDVFFFSRESVGVSHCMCVWTAFFIRCFLVKLYILFNRLILTVLPS